MKSNQIATYIDHTLLQPQTTDHQIDQLCAEAMKHQFYSVCVNPIWVKRAAKNLKGPLVCTVVGFPLGASTLQTKRAETVHAIEDGAQEIDMVMNIGAFKSKDFQLVKDDIEAVVQAAQKKPVKVILEIGLLSMEEIEVACLMASEAKAAFVKTSTGFTGGGATIEAVKRMRNCVGTRLGVKASGGIKDFATAMKFIEAGASRIGTSSGVAIVS
jgi:deoxyribose-phosphate aldolase